MSQSLRTIVGGAFFALSSIANSQWVQATSPSTDGITDLASSTAHLFVVTLNSGVYVSTDNGTSWVSRGLANTWLKAISLVDQKVFVAGGAGVFLSTDNGLQWIPRNSGLTSSGIWTMIARDSILLVADYVGGIWKSANDGESWVRVWNDPNQVTYDFSVSDSFTFAAENRGIILRSSNRGGSWTPLLNGATGNRLASIGSNVLVGGTSIYFSSNNGTTWTITNDGLPSPFTVWDFLIVDNDILVSIGRSVYLSIIHAGFWTNVGSGLTDSGISRLICDTVYLYAAAGTHLWRRPISEVTSVRESHSARLPDSFVLYQNYPNPFNSVTTISFNVASRSLVSLRIVDALGREATTLVSEELNAGKYVRQWDATAFASGIYLCRLAAGPVTEARKLILLR